jgi:hypothetical protein
MELGFDMLGVATKHVKYVVTNLKTLSRKKFSPHKVPKQQMANFGSEGMLGINIK